MEHAHRAGCWSSEDVHRHSPSEADIWGQPRSQELPEVIETVAGFEPLQLVRGGRVNPIVSPSSKPHLTMMSVHKAHPYERRWRTRADDPFASMRYEIPRSESEDVARNIVEKYSRADSELNQKGTGRTKSSKKSTKDSRSTTLLNRERQTARGRAREEAEPCDLEIAEEKHQVLIQNYSGNTKDSKIFAREWVDDFRNQYGFYPMRVALKTTKNTSGELREKRGVENVTCMKCMHPFKTVQDASIHIVSQHMQLKGFHCQYCEAAYARQDDLKRHLKTSATCSLKRKQSKVSERHQKEGWKPALVSTPPGHSDFWVPVTHSPDSFTVGTEPTHSHLSGIPSIPSIPSIFVPSSKPYYEYPPHSADSISYNGTWTDNKVATHWAIPSWSPPISW